MRLPALLKYSLFVGFTFASTSMWAVEAPSNTNKRTETKVQKNAASDNLITSKVKSKIMMDKSVSMFNVNVSTNNQVVTLTGNVDSDSQASTLVEIAQSTAGVTDVDATNLIVKESKQPFADMLMTSKVKGMFIQEKLFGEKDVSAMSIHVETNNGVVYLTGSAENKVQAENAIKIAKSVNGVKNVISSVTVGTVPPDADKR